MYGKGTLRSTGFMALFQAFLEVQGMPFDANPGFLLDTVRLNLPHPDM